jgi:hypothetical protein
VVDVTPTSLLRSLSTVYLATTQFVDFSVCLCAPRLWILAIVLDLMVESSLYTFYFLSYDACRLLLSHSLHIYIGGVT